MTGTAATVWQRIRPKTLIEWLVIVAIAGVLVALFLEPVTWVSDGSITVPVHIRVFNPVTGTPIQNARVGIVRYWPLGDQSKFEPLEKSLDGIIQNTTNERGSIITNLQFDVTASNRRPIPRAHLSGTWIVVDADGFDKAFVPIRHESLPTAELRTRGEIVVPVGLLKSQPSSEK